MKRAERLSISSVLVVAKRGTTEGPRIAGELARWLRSRGIRVRFDATTARALGRADGVPLERIPRGTDLVVVAGGDGTLLMVARSAGPLGIPILGVNFGGLGFMSELSPDEIFSGLEEVLAGRSRLDERMALRVRFRRGRKLLNEHTVLNDAVITKAALARMIVLDTRIDGEPVATYHSDGLILATPTGSTAYNLAAGGPILDPRMRAVVVAPICPHTLAFRPLVVPSTVKVEVRLMSETEEAYLTLDGQVGYPMRHLDVLEVEMHSKPVRLIRVRRRGFFEVLQRKLHWGGR